MFYQRLVILNKVGHRGLFLGPLLFIMFINDLASATNSARSHLNVDDTAIKVTSSNNDEMNQKLELQLNNVSN